MLKRNEIIFIVFVVVLLTVLILCAFYTNVTALEVALIFAIAFLTATAAIIPLIKDISTIRQENLIYTNQPPKSNKLNYCLMVIFILGFTAGMWWSFYSTDGANINQINTKKFQERIDLKTDTLEYVSNTTKDTLITFIDTITPRIHKTLSVLAEIDSISGNTLRKSRTIYDQLVSDKRLRDSIEQMSEVNRLYQQTSSFIKTHFNKFLHLQTNMNDIDFTREKALKLLEETWNFMNSQYNNRYLTENPYLLTPWSRFDSSLYYTAIALDISSADRDGLDSTLWKFNKNYECFVAHMEGYLKHDGREKIYKKEKAYANNICYIKL